MPNFLLFWRASLRSFLSILQVAHPNLLSLVRVMCEELNHAENLVGRIATGHLGARPKATKFAMYQERQERLKTLYVEGEKYLFSSLLSLGCLAINQIRLFLPFSLFQQIRLLNFPALVGTRN